MSTLPPNVPRRVVDFDRPRTITLQMPALERIEEALGFLDFDITVKRVPTFLWCALVDGDREDLTIDDIRALLHAGNVVPITEALRDLFVASAPEVSEGNAVPAPPKVKAGKRSR